MAAQRLPRLIVRMQSARFINTVFPTVSALISAPPNRNRDMSVEVSSTGTTGRVAFSVGAK